MRCVSGQRTVVRVGSNAVACLYAIVSVCWYSAVHTWNKQMTRDMTVADLEKALQAKRAKLDDFLANRARMRFELDGLDEQNQGLAGKPLTESGPPPAVVVQDTRSG